MFLVSVPITTPIFLKKRYNMVLDKQALILGILGKLSKVDYENPDMSLLETEIKNSHLKEIESMLEKTDKKISDAETNWDKTKTKLHIKSLIGVFLGFLIGGVVFYILHRVAGAYSKSTALAICLVSFCCAVPFFALASRYTNIIDRKIGEINHLLRKKAKYLDMQLVAFMYEDINRILYTKTLYKTMYENMYKVQEYLKENDKKGFNSFKKAVDALGVDFYEFVKVNAEKIKEFK